MYGSLYTILWIFYLYAALGWCAEVAFAAVKTRTFVNRGFLNGPYCPIYGVGMVIVVLCLTPIADNVVLLFVGSAVLTSLLELVTGFVLEKFFDDKWWDYSAMPLNIHGYICLPFSLLWGVACVLIMRILHPLILRLIRIFCSTPGVIVTVFLTLLFLADLAMTVATLLHLKKQIRVLTEVNARMHELSDKLGTGIYEGTIAALDASKKARTELAQAKEKERADMEQRKMRWAEEEAHIKEEIAASQKKTRAQLEQMLSRHAFGERRLLKAFPAYSKGKKQEAIEKLTSIWSNLDPRKKDKS